MRENAPSLVCIAYPSQNYRPGRDLGDCPGKPPIFLTSEELSNETRVVVVFFLKLFSDAVMAFHICTCNGWRPSHSRGLPEKHPCRPVGGKPSPQAKAGLPPVFGNKGLLKGFTRSFLHCVCDYCCTTMAELNPLSLDQDHTAHKTQNIYHLPGP